MTIVTTAGIPETMYVAMILLDIVLIYYAFTTDDTSYYTDILCCIGAMFLSGILAYNSWIGVHVMLADSFEYVYKAYAFSVMLAAMGLVMGIFAWVKAAEIARQEIDKL